MTATIAALLLAVAAAAPARPGPARGEGAPAPCACAPSHGAWGRVPPRASPSHTPASARRGGHVAPPSPAVRLAGHAA